MTTMLHQGSPSIVITLLLVLLNLSWLVPFSNAFGSDAFLKRLQSAQCALQVSVGRIPGTAMPPEWAASGARLGFLLEVEFCPEYCANYDMNKERLLGTAKPSFQAVEVLNDPSFVSSKGTEEVVVTPGAYGCDLQDLPAQQYGLRFFLDFPKGAIRNDVELPAERIYFISTAWIQDGNSLERARQRQEDLTEKLQAINKELTTTNREANGFLGKAIGFQHSVKLVERKEQLQSQLDRLGKTYPLQGQIIEGPNDLLFAKEGVIAVKRMRGSMGTREQYHWVGTFSYDEFFEDEYDDEED
uniref:Uncharacterized protein n=1 Tax=Odontella aurita TaxID=265563 RepID=A0A7S4N5T2_9STRA|mmetsp:Transcript_48021/g.145060  ORF Transcript_48021/g.145060 Transcript_48021/m.145060 type:complete len:300 (+) Transcript_48021:42-941(+)|eukprot:CAMPEP_0113557184 /NCGR_PEP_ID=MMETSP0015_2-20120614/17651_1 /TAXON_ID=2838 /ORGANISM="Odontella" /LENGTH=299 /DNA_ID=CAMNT_0000458583 /DNA_START=39 /DNA_END=938 /DNA_ORIENTATION=- /assembly_acc=CAM_ASM_000160